MTARTPEPPALLLDADRAERAGDTLAAVTAVRRHLERAPGDGAARLRLARLLAAAGETAAARQALLPVEALEPGDDVSRDANRQLAALDEAEGHLAAAIDRWERLLADDIDDPQARSHLGRLRPVVPPPGLDPGETLASPDGVEALRYRLRREIGRGATAAVYLAHDDALDIDVALKVLYPHGAGGAGAAARRRFFAEARLAAAIRHPGVAAVYDVDEAARALALEWIPGGTLRARSRDLGPSLATEELRATARRLLGALAYVHARGIVHGDIKPSNVLLRAPGDVVLADFGTALLVAEAVAAVGPLGPGGTPLYLAPEQLRGGAATPATDLYAAGAILYELTLGRPLRSHDELVRGAPAATAPADAARAALAARGAAWADLVTTLLSPDPAERLRAHLP